MTIRVSCPNPDCGAVASVEEQSLGKRGRCKKCGHVFALARPGGGPASGVVGDASAWKRKSEPASPTKLPEQFGRYRIMKQIGQGGMGAVYLAFDTKLEREVALKVPYFSPADGPQAVQRFEREAKAAATLDHPNLCPVHDVGEIDGIHFLTMPYIKGKPLSEVLDQNQTFTEVQVAAIGLKLAQALQEAHNKGIIHRDLKPSNIMMNRRRELIVMDFGLARISNDDNNPITQSGNVLGTALYMAPEQAAGDLAAIGPTADIYSLGVILYELLTGRTPFEGHWALVIGLKNVKNPDPPSKHRPDLNPALDAICHKAIAREPSNRQATMDELAKELEAFLKISREPIADLSVSETLEPIKSPESLAAQVFAGIITQDVSSLRAPVSARQPEPKPEKVADLSSNPPRNQRGTWTAVSVAGVLGGLLLIAWLPRGDFKVKTPEGTIVIENVPKDADVFVDDHKISFTWPGENKPIEIRAVPGQHKVEVAKDGFRTFGETVILKKDGSEEVTVRLDRKPPDRPEVQDVAVPEVRPKLLVAPFDAESASKARQGWADFLKRPVESSNTLGMKTVLIPPGEFLMGSTDEQVAKEIAIEPEWTTSARNTEYPPHRVRITQPFSLGKHEVTLGQYTEFVKATGYKTDAERAGEERNWQNQGFPQDQNHPVVYLTWKDGTAFCEWLSRKERQTYRLPTEAEWEYACRAGTTTIYHSGDDLEGLVKVGNIKEFTQMNNWKNPMLDFRSGPTAMGVRDFHVFTAPVGSFLPNAFGLFDMHGNIAEFCSDWFQEKLPADREWVDPQGPSTGSWRVRRGGGFISGWNGAHNWSALRVAEIDTVHNIETGFRVAMSLPKPAAEKLPGSLSDGSLEPLGSDWLQVGSLWVSEPGAYTFRILERQGEKFKAVFVVEDQVREIRGTIQEGSLRWLRKDVKALVGDPGFDTTGKIQGNEIAIFSSNPSGQIQGKFTLRLMKPKSENTLETGAKPDVTAPKPAETQVDPATGFKPLFNGKDLTGWVTPADKTLFRVEDGVILGQSVNLPAKNEYLVTDRSYGDFVLKVSVKFTSGNSGIQFRSRKADDGTVSGPQVDIIQGDWGSLYEEMGRGPLPGFSGKIDPDIREGDWNDLVITLKGEYVRVSLNGRVILERTDPTFERSGIIALQIHKGLENEIRFKDLEILDLDRAGPATEPAQPKTPEKTKKATGRSKKQAAETANPAARARVPLDSVPFGTNRYKLFSEMMTWPEAKLRCEELGGHLVIVNSQEENRFLVSLLETSPAREIWLGATDEAIEGKWVCVDGSRMEYSCWDLKASQPNNGGEFEHYAMMKSSGLWWDLPDHGIQGYKPGYVCEWERNGSPK